MSSYTTGELAKQCGVSVRTVQFYDGRGLLHPSALSEGGRRLYGEAELQRLRLICLLKSLGLSLDGIRGVLESPRPQQVLLLLLEEQSARLDREVREKQREIAAVRAVRESIRAGRTVSVESIRDVGTMMQQTQSLRRTHGILLAGGIAMDVSELALLLLWIRRGLWQPFAAGMPLVLLCGWLLFRFYQRRAAYVCPSCGETFSLSSRELFFSRHTPRTRKLRCPRCGQTDWCVETAADPAEAKPQV
jgi:DNA-binding transcriptional MerR regulator/DNA-directed RNA polymerase subunit RPC12/RpoP